MNKRELIYLSIVNFCQNLATLFNEIPVERKIRLQKISAYIQEKKKKNEIVQLIYVCTHNSRRSHFGQVWSAVASYFYEIENIQTFSGGTEVTAFNLNAIHALQKIWIYNYGRRCQRKSKVCSAIWRRNIYNVFFKSE